VHVVGTAGHVDHGKSTLVQALTGIDPDRLREEKEREMTIDLGFAWLTLPGGEAVGVVDVPGHRDFIENMLAGVGGIDAALLVVAVDEGVKPQTREHLAILDLLGIDKGLVALTKADLSESAEWTDMVAEDVESLLEGSVLEGCAIVPVSARTGEGLDDLLTALEEALSQVPARRDRGRPRLPVDRVFSISGFGTVVTGTLSDGHLAKGDEVEILPKGLTARIRGVQTHKQALDEAVPGSRVALNLTGVRKADLKRGDVVASPGWLKPTKLADVQIRLLADAARPLRHNAEVKFFCGAAEQMARVRLLDRDRLAPGDSAWAQMRLSGPLALVRGDRFVIRVPSPPATVGGGVVVDPLPGRTHRRSSPEVLGRLETLARGTPAELLLQELQRLGPSTGRELVSAASDVDAGEELVEQLVQGGDIVPLDGGGRDAVDRLLATREWWSTVAAALGRVLSDYHEEQPLRAGLNKEALRSRLALGPRVFGGVMARAVAESLVLDEGAVVRQPSHAVRLSQAQQKAVMGLLSAFEKQPYATPSVKESTAAVGPEVLEVLIARGDLVQVSDEVLFLAKAYEEMVAGIRERIQREGSISLAQLRDMFGTSRKYAQALLEHLDSEGITRREGDVRVLPQSLTK
jgi:selenocysteine-specific elongation factor